jgi:hypothetical protein
MQRPGVGPGIGPSFRLPPACAVPADARQAHAIIKIDNNRMM